MVRNQGNRKNERLDCYVPCRINTRNGEFSCRVINASLGGIGLSTDHLAALKVGDKVRISNGPLAGVAGIVRWISVPRYGLEFEQGSASGALIYSFLSTLLADEPVSVPHKA